MLPLHIFLPAAGYDYRPGVVLVLVQLVSMASYFIVVFCLLIPAFSAENQWIGR